MRTAIAAMIVLLFEARRLEAKSGEDGRDTTVWGRYELVDSTHRGWGESTAFNLPQTVTTICRVAPNCGGGLATRRASKVWRL